MHDFRNKTITASTSNIKQTWYDRFEDTKCSKTKTLYGKYTTRKLGETNLKPQ